MTEHETWEKFQGKCVEYRAKFKDTYMCPRFHTKGICHVKCKFAASHITAKDITEEVKKVYCNYLTKIRKWNREPGQGLAVPDPDLNQNFLISQCPFPPLSS
jgi:hypothetical protein